MGAPCELRRPSVGNRSWQLPKPAGADEIDQLHGRALKGRHKAPDNSKGVDCIYDPVGGDYPRSRPCEPWPGNGAIYYWFLPRGD